MRYTIVVLNEILIRIVVPLPESAAVGDRQAPRPAIVLSEDTCAFEAGTGSRNIHIFFGL